MILRWLLRLLRGACPRCRAPLRFRGALRCVECGSQWDHYGRLRIHPEVVATARQDLGQDADPSQRPAAARSGGLIHLDLGPLSPLSREETLRQADQLGARSGNPWFGRRDLIPPLSDPRTQLIDRGMAAEGFITPEELVEVHRVGEEMDRVRPDLALAAVVAEQAVALDRDERARRKQQKKGEAEVRRRQRQQAIAHRHRTDIVFLGRGVSRGLADRTCDEARLRQSGLPVLATPADVSGALELSIPRLRWLAFHTLAATRVHYVSFTVPKRSGGLRRLAAPHRDLARCQRWIFVNILQVLRPHGAAHGFVAGRGTVSNATPHAGRHVVLNLDLKDFFPSITYPRVQGWFAALGYSPAAATILALLCTECPRREVEYAGERLHVACGPRSLPQGACTSPAISNLVAFQLDCRLAGLAAKLGWTYTRYADDLTFSAAGSATDQTAYLLARVRHIAAAEGFAVHEGKTRVQRPHQAQTVTGVVVNQRPAAPRELVRRLRAILHRAQSQGLAAQNREGRADYAAWLRGMIAYVQMLNPRQGARLKQAFDALPSRL